MGKTSRDKGARGEREVVAFLRAEGYDAHRGHQLHQKGGADNPDVLALPGIHIEVKRTEAFRMEDAMAQAHADCGDRMPTVWHRRNNGRWRVIMEASDWIQLYRAWEVSDEREGS